ncbi:MAG: hypothetical protein A4E64_01758 [Syntrophorhabdus sp. PtaU1.Bin058]|nr:MAG: hypothetical protein A4E64_01758 [Syntrophorhabdus sp. PtaU1.Bin058]
MLDTRYWMLVRYIEERDTRDKSLAFVVIARSEAM